MIDQNNQKDLNIKFPLYNYNVTEGSLIWSHLQLMCKWTSAWIESRYFTNVTTDSDLRGMSRRCSEILKSSITLPRSTILILVIRSSWTFLFVTKIFIKGLVNKIKIADMSSWKDWPTVSTNNSQQKIFLRTDCYKNAEGVSCPDCRWCVPGEMNDMILHS